AGRPCGPSPRVVGERLRHAWLRAAARPRERDLARRVEALDPREREDARCDVGVDRRAGDERDAVAREHRAARRLLQAELEPYVEVAEAHAALPQLVLDHLPNAGTLLHEHDRLFPQLVDRHLLAREAM